MNKLIAAASCALLASTSPVFALPKQQDSTVECSCYCKDSSGGVEVKSWTWSHSRQDCQAYTGSSCTNNKNSSRAATGQLSLCDTIVSLTAQPVNTRPTAPIGPAVVVPNPAPPGPKAPATILPAAPAAAPVK